MKECQSACMVIKNCHSAHFLPSALSVKGILREGTWKIAVVEGEKDEEAAGEMTPEDGPSTGQQSGYRLNMGIPPHSPPLPIQTHKAGGLTTSHRGASIKSTHKSVVSHTAAYLAQRPCLDGVAISAQAGNS